ncbi:LOW QUALITY PROTEIN: hypothetical protein HID58_008751 [Brassica napus]|uniref:Uncharacterized protein n=1 Tax=Brassica napus TaxID=3708 RepID=A0ABQ8DQJ0_BRANA|nr:LOW QUALITY PROTEIN: hypothetical protein HID58_008751 [Brassica napus]
MDVEESLWLYKERENGNLFLKFCLREKLNDNRLNLHHNLALQHSNIDDQENDDFRNHQLERRTNRKNRQNPISDLFIVLGHLAHQTRILAHL